MAKCPFQWARLLRFFRPLPEANTFGLQGQGVCFREAGQPKISIHHKEITLFERDSSLRIQANKNIEELESDKNKTVILCFITPAISNHLRCIYIYILDSVKSRLTITIPIFVGVG